MRLLSVIAADALERFQHEKLMICVLAYTTSSDVSFVHDAENIDDRIAINQFSRTSRRLPSKLISVMINSTSELTYLPSRVATRVAWRES